tara:strand:+ start:37 stop:246 length:210 start_codon:yes stop_codon:yes gene_type:complete
MDQLNNNIEELYREKYDMINKLKIIEKKINILEKERISKCDHEWVTEREPGVYGEKYTYCKYCKVNRVW